MARLSCVHWGLPGIELVLAARPSHCKLPLTGDEPRFRLPTLDDVTAIRLKEEKTRQARARARAEAVPEGQIARAPRRS